MTSEFDFLPRLPKSDLDDRVFQDLVTECLLRIPRYCPEWTNYNPSDPGVTLIELFAWLTDQMMMRFNKVPRRNYIAFLEMLGVRLQAPAPAQSVITFYLSASLPDTYTIPAETEVATIRTETEQSISFTTDRACAIARPKIRNLLTANRAEPIPRNLRDRFSGVWTENRDESWTGAETSIFEDEPQLGNCFYVLFDGEQPTDGNVIALKVRGEAATSTGINPDSPPRFWEAWDGSQWQSVLLKDSDDQTKGFSFSDLVRNGGNPVQGAEVILHLPITWAVAQFGNYRGRWLRCTYLQTQPNQAGYSRSPRIVGLSVRSFGGSVPITQCTVVANEVLGESTGKAGQAFQLLQPPILPRQEGEHILVIPPVGLPQVWQEVKDFSNSTANDLHYTIDSGTGLVQFGPLVLTPSYLRSQIYARARLQGTPMERVDPSLEGQEFAAASGTQYGAVPPKGATIQMVRYRTGGGLRGNVQRGTIRFLKTAVPYVASIINHQSAVGGGDAESLEEAAIRVPRLLRTRDRAVTKEDFETLTLEAGSGAISRVLCLSATNQDEAGIVRLLLVPSIPTSDQDSFAGVHPDRFRLSPALIQRVQDYLDDRKLLGVQVRCLSPDFVGVSVQTEVSLEPAYQNPLAQQAILDKLQTMLYRFLNPVTGGGDGRGWEFGRPVYPSDIITLLQKVEGVRYLGTIQLFELRKQGEQGSWRRTLPREPIINPGVRGLICSWRDTRLRSGHLISIV
jgi:predicted phage baseplate assembly protein